MTNKLQQQLKTFLCCAHAVVQREHCSLQDSAGGASSETWLESRSAYVWYQWSESRTHCARTGYPCLSTSPLGKQKSWIHPRAQSLLTRSRFEAPEGYHHQQVLQGRPRQEKESYWSPWKCFLLYWPSAVWCCLARGLVNPLESTSLLRLSGSQIPSKACAFAKT